MSDDHIGVTFSALRDLADDLEDIIKQLNEKLETLYARTEKVVLTWEGEARDTFVDELDKWDRQMRRPLHRLDLSPEAPVSLKPLEHDHAEGEFNQVDRAYLGRTADDEEAITDCLRRTCRTRPWSIANAEFQLRECARNPPVRLRPRLGEFCPLPDVGLPDAQIQAWLLMLADRLKESVETGQAPPPAPPRTDWEWRARFPELAQLLGGWYS
ncbi:WXG100 family type VII secretion target [Streptomyces sp. SID8358]|uniref:WXG100 family type VII secretion target n=1 Tax=Streptomyces sp. SID8358 TaxID=2690342 RepID=UPI000DAF0A76|nr:WXG100 family type VII secretion target [Streptomyces sp. SID8358]